MEAFIKVYFWLAVFGLVTNILTLAVATFSKTEVHGIGYYIANVLVGLPFCLWAAWLMWA